MGAESIDFLNNMGSADTRNLRSGFMADIPLQQLLVDDPGRGWIFHKKFHSFRTAANVNAAEAYWAQGLNVFGSNTAALTALDVLGGGITLNPTNDNLGISLHQAVPPFQITRTARTLWFEARIKVSSIADALADVFVGLTDSTANTVNIPITTAGALADVNLVGFFLPESAKAGAGTGGATVNTVYKASGVAAVTVQNDAATLVADTFVKLGMRWDQQLGPFNPTGKFTLTFFIDGVPCATQKVVPTGVLAEDFPNNNRFGFCLAAMGSNAAPRTVSISQVTIAQLATLGPN